jgi:NAD(P)-dependent dehydrogenase (short-subunit alcohol dehydrogenase family)
VRLLVVGVRGLGAHVARWFAGKGWDVLCAARTKAAVDALAGEIGARGLVLDLRDPATLAQLATEQLDLVVAAQTSDARFEVKPVLESDPEALRLRFEGYPLATLRLLQAVRPALRDRGTFVQIGTTLEPRPRPGFGAMHAAQHATRALLAAAAQELKPAGVHVAYLAVEGQIATDASRGYIERHGIGKTIPPDEICRALEFLHAQDPRAWSHELAVRPSAD